MYDTKLGKLEVSLTELGGGPNIRGIWKYYLLDAYGVIYVIDSSDISKLEESRKILRELLANPHLEGKPFLILANKQDVSSALDYLDIFYFFGLEELANSHQSPCMLEVTGNFLNTNGYSQLEVAIEWFITSIVHRQKAISNTIKFYQQLEDVKSELAKFRPVTGLKHQIRKSSKKMKSRPKTAPNVKYKEHPKRERPISPDSSAHIDVSNPPSVSHTHTSPIITQAQSLEYFSDNPDNVDESIDKSSKNITEVKVQVHREDENSPKVELPLLNNIHSITAISVPNGPTSNKINGNHVAGEFAFHSLTYITFHYFILYIHF